MAAVEGVKVHTHGRVNHGNSTRVDGDVFSFKGGSTGCVKILEPMTPFLNYYEYEILCKGAESSIGIGVGERSYPLYRMPGWNINSIGYHGDDGKLYHQNGRGSQFGPTCTEGDRMGCGVDFETDVGYGYCEVFFTKNGQPVGNAVKMKRPVFGLYPIIGLHSRGEKVRYLGHWHKQRQGLLEPMIQDHSPSNVWLRSNNVKYLEDGLTLEYCGAGDEKQDVSLAQARYPLDRTNYYFELEIISRGSQGAVAIGLGKSSYPLYSHPGWSKGAVGYHADDGKLFVEQGKGQEFGPVCSEGDRMGCGIVFHTEDMDKGRLEEAQKNEVDDYNSLEDDTDEDDISLDELLDDDEEALFYRELMGGGGWLEDFIRDRPPENFVRRRPFRGRGGFMGPRIFRPPNNVQYVPPHLKPKGGAALMDSVMDDNSGSKCTVYFTKNGEKVGETEVSIPKGGFFPLVGMLSIGEKIRVDLQPLTG